ncbi:MAG TPA: flagellar basal body P-ring formation chaperone FlgA [Alphaproteobacteria bacterium]|nr:flagellar basal body P-ring formation chaperone FlgA [Alphaproteobacteria bacterium]
MKQIVVMLCTAVIFVFAVASANATTLRPRAEVVGDRVTLGDLFDGLEPNRAAIAIAQAPAPGRQIALDTGWIAQVARAYRIDWQGAALHRQIVLTRKSHRLGADAVVAEIEASIAGQVPEGKLEIQLDNRGVDIHLPLDAPPSLRVRDLSYDRSSGRFAGTVVAPADGRPLVQLAVTGRAVSIVEVPVVTRRISRDETIGAADIGWIEVTSDRAGLDVIMDAGDLVGMSPRRALAAMTPVRVHDVERPIDVKRGDAVTMTLQSGALVLTARGRALDQGARGQVIRVINVDSNRTVEAVVAGPNLVSVSIGTALASLN